LESTPKPIKDETQKHPLWRVFINFVRRFYRISFIFLSNGMVNLTAKNFPFANNEIFWTKPNKIFLKKVKLFSKGGFLQKKQGFR